MFILLAISGIVGAMFYSNKAGDSMSDKKVEVPNKFDDLFKKYADIYGLDWKMLKRISWIESNTGLNSRVAKGLANPNDVDGSKSYDGLSWGLMQVTVVTAKDYDPTASAVKLNNPAYSIETASKHIKMLKKLFSNDRDVIMAYNQGQGNQKRFIELEKSGKLLTTQYPQAREYWAKYSLAKGVIP